MKKVLFMSLAFCYFSCGQKTENTAITKDTTVVENKVEELPYVKPAGNIYRCDGFRNGIASEWIQVKYVEDGSKVEAIWFWDSNNSEKLRLKILDEENMDGEISATTGTLKFPENEDKFSFVIIEDRFGLTDVNENYQEFDYEDVEF